MHVEHTQPARTHTYVGSARNAATLGRNVRKKVRLRTYVHHARQALDAGFVVAYNFIKEHCGGGADFEPNLFAPLHFNDDIAAGRAELRVRRSLSRNHETASQ